MTMTLSAVAGSLEHDARMATAEAETTPDYRTVVVSLARARRLRDMAQAVRAASVPPAVNIVAKRLGRPAKAFSVVKLPVMSALDFWSAHKQAVASISSRYGAFWSFKAPHGQTVIASVPAKYRSHKTERGTRMKWMRDHRMPAAEYWPGSTLPIGVETTPDHERHDPNKPTIRDDAWHLAHGYVWNGTDWVAEIMHRAWLARMEAIQDAKEYRRIKKLEEAALNYGPQPLQPFADIDDMRLAEAAD